MRVCAFLCIWDVEGGCREVERTVEFRFRQGRVRRIDNDGLPAYGLQDARCGVFIALFFDMAEIGGLFLFVFQAFFVREKDDVLPAAALL